MHRRQFLASLLSLASYPAWSTLGTATSDISRSLVVSAVSDQAERHWLVSIDSTNQIVNRYQLPSRAHEVAIHPTKPIVCVFGRRPGYFARIYDLNKQSLFATIQPQKGYHLYGHGVFSSNGNFLYTAESHIESGRGYIVVRDLSRKARVYKRFPSNGIGPHQLKIMPDNETLVVANGGILTRPNTGRKKLNLDTMTPSLDYLDAYTGQVIENHALDSDMHKLSIRHIDVNNDGLVCIAMQNQDSTTSEMPLIATHKQGQTIQPVLTPPDLLRQMKGYAGSITYDSSGRYIAVSAPKGDLVTFLDAKRIEHIGQIRCRDACGLTPADKDSFLISSGTGKLYRAQITDGYTIKKEHLHSHQELAFDNHLSLVRKYAET